MMPYGCGLMSFGNRHDSDPHGGMLNLTQNSSDEASPPWSGFPFDVATFTGGWVQQEAGTQFHTNRGQPVASDQVGTFNEITDPKHGYQSSEEPWTTFDAGRISPLPSRQTAYPSPTESSYVYDARSDRTVPPNYTDYSQSTLVSQESEQSFVQFQDPQTVANFISSISVKVVQRQTQSYVDPPAESYPPPRPHSACDPRLLTFHQPNQPENDNFVNNTAANFWRTQSPSATSRMSDGKISRPRRPPAPPTERRSHQYPCPDCDKKFNTPSERTHHEVIHSDHPPHVCPECGMGFCWQKDLTRHMPKHTKVKGFTCTVTGCGKKFTRRDNRRRHEENPLSHLSQSSRSSQLGV